METNDDCHVPRWHDDSLDTPEGTIRQFFGVLDYNGRMGTNEPYVEIIKSPEGVWLESGDRTSLWCYAFEDCDMGWLELPEGVAKLEEAQATALTLWRMHK